MNQGVLVMGIPQGDGVLAPGGSIGTTAIAGDYNLISGSLEIEIQAPGLTGGSDYDLVELTGPLSAAGLDGTLEVVLLGGYVPAYGTTFDVVTAPEILLGPNFALDDSGAPMPDWMYFEVSVVGLGDGQALQLTVLPEPAALSLLAVGGLILLRRRRTRQRADRG